MRIFQVNVIDYLPFVVKIKTSRIELDKCWSIKVAYRLFGRNKAL